MLTRNAVCLCADRNFLVPALFVADAVQKFRAEGDPPFDILVFTGPDDVTDAEREWMADRGLHHRDDLDTAHFSDISIWNERLSQATLMRLCLAAHLESEYDRLLYLDADLTIHDRLGPLFRLDTGEFPLAAVESGRIWMEPGGARLQEAEAQYRALGMTPPYSYFNSGVLYIDVAKWNRADLGTRSLDFIRNNSEICGFADEDSLNALLDGRIAWLSPIWNMRPGGRWRAAIHEIAQPVILHHVGDAKPWRPYGYHRRLLAMRQYFQAYEAFVSEMPEWQAWLDAQWGWRDVRANLAWEARRVTRLLRGRPEAPSRQQRAAYIAAFKEMCAQTNLVDVEQGIVSGEGGRLRLGTSLAEAA